MDVEYDAEGNSKSSHLPDLDQDWLDLDGEAAYDKIGCQPLRFQTPSHSATMKRCPLHHSPHPTPPSPVRTNIGNNSKQESIEFEALGGAPIPPGEVTNSSSPLRQARTYKDEPDIDRRLPTEGRAYELAFHSICN